MSLFRRILTRIMGDQGPANIRDNARLMSDGFIKAGAGCNLSAMNVILADKRPGNIYLEIGNDCCICGTIVLYRASSKVVIGNNVYIGPGTYVECSERVTIGSNVLISMHCNIIDTNSHSIHSSERMNDSIEWQKGHAYKNWNTVVSSPVEIGDKCWVGLRSIILKGVKLGEGVIVGAGSVVTRSVSAFSLVGGNPACFIKEVD
ncbi:acyltransferase [Flavitalea sp. BT771]|uniref:acyltransferase n=1 Tax=Flavitalea sp. BT771 TaxID=3063329 RepID=UPI0026E302AD|nr:acyltransferase [Flavitalea sp. BT771]MDO6434160.1 acyltransferase [Flavitalea sp. BT771]MDV6223060.1 acyltransferase [Flavitalea sp. BT771]